MKNLLYLCQVFLVVQTIYSCQQVQEPQSNQLRVDSVQYTAYRWRMADNELGWELFLAAYVKILKDGNFKVMRRESTVDTAEFFEGKIGVSVYPLLDSLSIVSLDSFYVKPELRIYDGNTYLLSFIEQQEHNIHFLPMDAPPFLQRLSISLDSVIWGSGKKIAALELGQHEIQLKEKFLKAFGTLPKPEDPKFLPVIDSNN